MLNNPRPAVSNTLPTVAAGNWDSIKCGTCVKITPLGTGSGNSDFPKRAPFVAYINNQCPECGPNNLDLAETSDGRWDIDWEVVPCPVTDGIKLQLKSGSSIWHTEVSARDYAVGLKSLEIYVGTTWISLPRQSYNYFVYSSQVSTPVQVRLTSIDGQVLLTTISSYNNLEPGLITTGLQFTSSSSPSNPPPSNPPPSNPPPSNPPPSNPPPSNPPPSNPPPSNPPPSTGFSCTYAHDDIWWVEINAPSSASSVRVDCPGKSVTCEAKWGKWVCDPAGVACNKPRSVYVNNALCTMGSVVAIQNEGTTSATPTTPMIPPYVWAIVGVVLLCLLLVGGFVFYYLNHSKQQTEKV